jgi:hypothetical protein
MSGGEGAIWRRRVFYIPGYDPFPARRYRELYRSEGARQAGLAGYGLTLLPDPGNAGGWRVQAAMDGQQTEAVFEVLGWSDLVQGSMGQGIVATYLQLARTVRVYVASGAIFRLVRLRKGPTIAAFYPVLVLLAALALAVVSGMMTGRGLAALAGPLPGGAVLPVLAGLAVGLAVLALVRRLDRWHYAFYLMHDYAHTASGNGHYPADLEARLGDFRVRIEQALAEDWDEVLLVGHSSGVHLAVTVLAAVLRERAEGAGGPAIGLLTLGHVVPMLSFLPRAAALRGDLAFLSARDDIAWVDVTAPGDGCAFALCDPVAVSVPAPAGRRWPLVLSAAFTRTLRPETWRRLRWRFFRLHFQYLCAFDNLTGAPGEYDYFRITAGPETLGARFQGRQPSPSRIVRLHSGFAAPGRSAA